MTSEAFANSSGVGDEVLHVGADLAGRGEGDADLGAVRGLHEAAVEVGEVLRDQHRRHEGARHVGVLRPVLDLDEGLAEVGHVEGIALGGDEVGVVEDHRHLQGARHHLPVPNLGPLAREGEDSVDDLEGPLRVAGKLVAQVEPLDLLRHGVESSGGAAERVDVLEERLDLPDSLVRVRGRGAWRLLALGAPRAGRLDPHAAPPVVPDDDVERPEHRAGQEVGERHEVGPALAVGCRHEVEGVAVQDELAGRAGLEDLAHLLGPRGEPRSCRRLTHSALLAGGDYPRRTKGLTGVSRF